MGGGAQVMKNGVTSAPDDAQICASLETGLDFIRYGVSCFQHSRLHFGHGTDNAVDEARLLVCHALHLPADVPDGLLSGRLLGHEKQRVLALFAERVERRCPAAYLTGEAWFAGLSFQVDPRVIVPRSPIAELIENGFAPWVAAPDEVATVMDMCTGSGCIAVACAFAFPNARIDAVDISGDALDVAASNVAAYGLGDRVRLLRSDLFDAVESDSRYSLIVCNPPYVAQSELDAMPAEYRAEPALALAAGEQGLDLASRILAGAARHLSDDGLLVLELGNAAAAAEERWPTLPFTWVEFERGGYGVAVLHAADLRRVCAREAQGGGDHVG
jgi:ribosomal protein L3 glutamine methyltransferase